MSSLGVIQEQANRVVTQLTASGQERLLAVLPKSWAWTKVGELAEVFRGASPRPKGDPRYFGGLIPWIMISDVTSQPGKYLFSTKEGVTEAGAALSRRLHSGSLILSNSGTVCVPKILRVEGCIHDGFIAFNGLENSVSLDFAYWWFEYVRDQIIQENRQGVTQVNLNTDIVRNIHFALAPLNEQGRIVGEIEKQFTRLDDAVAALKRVQANLKRYRASVLKAACDGRLVPTEAELARKEGRDYEPASELLKRILGERRAKWESDQLKKMIAAGKASKSVEWKNAFEEPPPPQNSDLHDLPVGWVWTTCGVIADAIDPQPSHRTPAEYPGGVPYIGMGDVTSDGELDRCGALKVQPFVLKEHQERYTLHEGDFFVGKIGTLGKPVRVSLPYDYALSANIVLIQPVSFIDARFLFYWMASPALERMLIRDSRATTQAAFGIKRFRVLPCPLPPFAEQQRIANEIERRTSAIAAINRDFQSLTARSARLRQSILKTAFSGRLVSQDPNDEPASMLLERIRAARAALATNNGNHKVETKTQNNNSQRRKPGSPTRAGVARGGAGRRVARLAQRVSAGKG